MAIAAEGGGSEEGLEGVINAVVGADEVREDAEGLRGMGRGGENVGEERKVVG